MRDKPTLHLDTN